MKQAILLFAIFLSKAVYSQSYHELEQFYQDLLVHYEQVQIPPVEVKPTTEEEDTGKRG